MSDNLPATTDTGWFAEWISNGKIPGAVKAVAHLVGSVGNAGAAWLNIATVKGEQLQQDIKNETEGRKQLYTALAKAAQKQAVTDPALVDRAIDRLAGKALRSQTNVEAVAKKVAENIDEGDQIDPATTPPSDDWLDFVTSQAERANAEKIRDTWAKVIAGEIRKPGSFSFRTLQFISVLDQNTATRIEAVLALVCNDMYVPYPDRFDFTDLYPEVKFARECGVLNDVQVFNVEQETDPRISLRFGSNGILIAEASASKYKFPHLPLTVVGRELYNLIKPAAHFSDLQNVTRAMFKTNHFKYVHAQTQRHLPNGDIEVENDFILPEGHTPSEDKDAGTNIVTFST